MSEVYNLTDHGNNFELPGILSSITTNSSSSRKLIVTSEFSTFLQNFATNSSSDTARNSSKALLRLLRLVTNGNVDDIRSANPLATGNVDGQHNQPSTFTDDVVTIELRLLDIL